MPAICASGRSGAVSKVKAPALNPERRQAQSDGSMAHGGWGSKRPSSGVGTGPGEVAHGGDGRTFGRGAILPAANIVGDSGCRRANGGIRWFAERPESREVVATVREHGSGAGNSEAVRHEFHGFRGARGFGA